MKTSTFLVAVLASLPLGFAQSLAPSPTESVGCEPHGDHWHCDGPRNTASGAASATSPAADEDHDHDHEHEDEDDHDHDHDHAAGSVSLAPSPTQSVGCEPHGDHWHCDGPRATTGPSSTPSSNANNDGEDNSEGTSSTTGLPGAAATAHALPLAGLIAAVVLAL